MFVYVTVLLGGRDDAIEYVKHNPGLAVVGDGLTLGHQVFDTD